MIEGAVPPSATRLAAAPSLDIADLSKSFGEVKALDKVRLSVGAGEVHALLGHNGSGKSTLIKVLSGFYQADPGARITLDHHEVDLSSASHSNGWRSRLRFVHQDLALVETLNAIENLALERGFTRATFGRVDWTAERRHAQKVFTALGFNIDIAVPLGRLNRAERSMVAIARALQDWDENQFGVLVLDEPTASLSRSEAAGLYAAVSRVAARGAGVLLVTHQLDDAMAFARTYTILRDGVLAAAGDIADISEGELVEMLVGRKLDDTRRKDNGHFGDAVMDVDSVVAGNIGPLSFSVRAGEIVGIAGLQGSGREQIADMLAGAARYESGTVKVDGRWTAPGSLREALRHGVALLPAERLTKGMCRELSVQDNLLLSRYQGLRRGIAGLCRIRTRAARVEAATWVERLDVRPSDARIAIGSLSGGNQQKVVLARALRLNPRVLVLDEPTQGVDVGARSAIYALINAAARNGMAVVLCSTDDTELAAECDRVLVLREGRVAAELLRPLLTEDAITAVSLSGSHRHTSGDETS